MGRGRGAWGGARRSRGGGKAPRGAAKPGGHLGLGESPAYRQRKPRWWAGLGTGGCPQQGLGSTGGSVQPRLCRAGVFGVLLAPCLHPPCVSAPRDLPRPCRGAVALRRHPRGQRVPKQLQTLWQRAPSVPPEQGAQNGGAATAANSQQMRSRHRKARCQGSSCCPSLRGVGALQRVFR